MTKLLTTLTIPPNVKYVELFKKLFKEAREQGRGLWSENLCTQRVILDSAGMCKALCVGFQFNQLIEKCETVRGGCCFSGLHSPFNSLAECQNICEIKE